MRFALARLSVALAAVACASAVGATVAQAISIGPRWSVAGSILKTGESTYEAKSAGSSSEITIHVPNQGITVTCKQPALTNGSIAGGAPGSIKGSLAMNECTIAKNGEKCTKVTNFALGVEGSLAYANSARSGKILALLKLPKSVELKFSGERCKYANTVLRGSLAAELAIDGKPQEVGTHEGAGKVVALTFPTTSISHVWAEKEGTLTEEEAKLTGFAETVTVGGAAELDLVGLQEWGAVALTSKVPKWHVEGLQLAHAEEREVVSTKTPGEIAVKLGPVITMKCKAATVEKAAILGGEPGSIKAALALQECTMTGNGEGCNAPAILHTKVLEGPLAYQTSEGTGKILALLKSKGAIIEFAAEGAGCKFKSFVVSGGITAELVSGGQAEEVRGHEASATAMTLQLPTTPITTVWVDENEVLKQEKSEASVFGEAVVFSGNPEVQLSGLGEFGAYAF